MDRNRIENLAEEGHRGAISTLKGLRSLSFQLSGAQLGITVSSLLLGFVLEPTVGRLFRPVLAAFGLPEGSAVGLSVLIALVLVTAAQMVLGELVPKNLAIARPLPTAYAVATPLRLVNALFSPVIRFLNASANWTVRLLGIEPREELIPVRSLEELGLLISSSRREGALAEEEFTLLSRSITFRGKTAAEALRPRTQVVAIHAASSVQDLIDLALETGHSRFPVYGRDLDEITGVAHIRDVYRYAPDARRGVEVAEIATPVPVVPEARDLASLLAEMRQERKQLAVVVDEYGGTAGIITLEDVLEEIVGDIEDEYDADTAQMTAQPTGVSVVSGMLHRDELADRTGFEMPEGDYETFAGFLLTLFDRIPERGDHTSYDGWEFKVVEMEGKRIARVLVVAAGEQQETQ